MPAAYRPPHRPVKGKTIWLDRASQSVHARPRMEVAMKIARTRVESMALRFVEDVCDRQ